MRAITEPHMHTLSGACHCGSIRVELELARSPESYHPRACDCEFCRKHAAAWVSDPQGALSIRIANAQHAGRYRQGSGLAELLWCRNCGVLVGALHEAAGRLHAAVNAKVIDGGASFGVEHAVSPQSLSDREKLARWQEIWFARVSIVAGEGAVPPLASPA
jgi:hypothetical protein